MLAACLDADIDLDRPWVVVDHCLAIDDRDLVDRAMVGYRAAAAKRHATSPEATLESAVDDARPGDSPKRTVTSVDARERYERAWRTFADYGWHTPAGVIRGWLGRCLLDHGEVAAAVEHLQAGRQLATTLGLAAVIVEIDANLARAGVEPLIA